jgi:hypothetical protein
MIPPDDSSRWYPQMILKMIPFDDTSQILSQMIPPDDTPQMII